MCNSKMELYCCKCNVLRGLKSCIRLGGPSSPVEGSPWCGCAPDDSEPDRGSAYWHYVSSPAWCSNVGQFPHIFWCSTRLHFGSSPILSSIDWILERTVQVAGIQVRDHLYTDLDYADDVVPMAEETDSLRASLEQFHENAGKLGLHLSWQKTKVQNLGFGDPESDMTLYGNTVEGAKIFGELPWFHPVVIRKKSS